MSLARPVALLIASAIGIALAPSSSLAQPPPDTREGVIAAQQADKARVLRPYKAGFAEALIEKVDEHLISGHVRWYPFYGPAYLGAGLTLGAGYKLHRGEHASVDVRGAMSINTSARAEAEYRRTGLFGRRGVLTAAGAWRKGVDQSFFGLGPASALSDRTRFDFRQVSATADLTTRPWRGAWVVAGGGGVSRIEQPVSAGSVFAERHAPANLPGAGATIDYLLSHGTLAFDWRGASGYARRGGYYGVTARRFDDTGGPFSFQQVDYEVVQHVPVRREAWVLSLRGRVETTYAGRGEAVPFFLLPSLGNGSTLRGFTSWRFRDRNSLLLSAEWRVLLNAFSDLAFFYDAGMVAARRRDLGLADLEGNYGIGLRLHTPSATPIRIDVARSSEGFRLVFGSSAAF